MADDGERPMDSIWNDDGQVARRDPATLWRLDFTAGGVLPLSTIHRPLDVSRRVRVGRVAREVQRVADFALSRSRDSHLSRCDCKMDSGELET